MYQTKTNDARNPITNLGISDSKPTPNAAILDTLIKKINKLKEDLEITTEECHRSKYQLDEEKRRREVAEIEVSNLQRNIQIIEEDLEKTEDRLIQSNKKLHEASQAADESERLRKLMESRLNHDSDRVEMLEKHLKEARELVTESDSKFEEVSAKLVILELEVEKSQNNFADSQNKINNLEEELRLCNNALKTLAQNEQKVIEREERYEIQIKEYLSRLKSTEQRADQAEVSMAKLQKEVDKFEDELSNERMRSQSLQLELNKCIADLESN